MRTWVNGRKGHAIDVADRGLQYGDGLFETMLIRRGSIRLLDFHLDRLGEGCRRLGFSAPVRQLLRREISRAAASQDRGVLKLILTRGTGERGYRATGREQCSRILTLHAEPARSPAKEGSAPRVRVRLCATPLGRNPRLAGLKTLNRLESVLARAEWRDVRIWEGLMSDEGGNVVCGTMSNLFIRRGDALVTPPVDQCGVAGVMRRWVLSNCPSLDLRAVTRPVRWRDLAACDEVFLTNAVVGIRSVCAIQRGRERLRFAGADAADRLRAQLERV